MSTGNRGRKVTDGSIAKRARAAAARAEGLTWRQVAETCGYSTMSGAQDAVRRHRAAQPAEDLTETRKDMLGELATMDTILDELRNRKFLRVTQAGHVVMDPETRQPLEDVEPVFTGIKIRLAVQKRRSELLGVDAPVRTQSDVTIIPPEIPPHLAKLVDGEGG